MIPDYLRPTPEKMEEVKKEICDVSSVVKMNMGVCNNCAYIVIGNSLDAVKTLPVFKGKVKYRFNMFTQAWREYENALRYGIGIRYFHVEDMGENTREYFKRTITDDEYFEYWRGLGGAAYMNTQNELNVLHHKFELSLTRMGYGHTKELASMYLGAAVLSLAVEIYKGLMDGIAEHSHHINHEMCGILFSGFSLVKPKKAYEQAVEEVEKAMGIDSSRQIDSFDKNNIRLAVEQLENKWCDEKWMLRAGREATKDYRELFNGKKAYNTFK